MFKVPVGTVVKDDKVTVVDLESEGDQVRRVQLSRITHLPNFFQLFSKK